MIINIKIFLCFLCYIYDEYWLDYSFLMPDGCNIVCSLRNGLYYARQCFFCDPKKSYFTRLKYCSTIKLEAFSCVLIHHEKD